MTAGAQVAPSARPLTVLHVNTERGWRGGERQTLWLARELRAMGHRSLLAARGSEPLAERARAEGVAVHPTAPVGEFDPFAALALRRVVRREAVDVVHAHAAHAVALAALATAGLGVPMVLTRRVDFHLRRNVGTRWKYGRAASIIAISSAVARILEESGVARDRIALVPSGIDLTRRIVPATPETLAALGVPPGAPLVVQVAQLVGHKDPVTFVRAVAAARSRVPALHALMVGDGPLRPQVEAAIAEHGLGEVLHLAGYRTDADSLLAAADVVTLSSREEGLGTVLLDALSLGKPVAACSAGGIPEVVQHGVSGLLAPVGEAKRLGDAIADILLDAARRARFAEAAVRRAEEFSVRRTAELTAQVYERVVAGA